MKNWTVRIAKSKTMIFGLLLSIAGVVQASTDFLSTVLNPHQFGYLMLGIGITVKVLRFFTNQPLEDK